MNLQVKRQSLKIQLKSLNPSRSSLPSKHQNPYSLKQRSFVNYASITTVNPNITLKSAKTKLQSKQPYLLEQPIQKNYVSEIQKLTQICQQFYHENQRLKIQLKQQTIRDTQMWKNKVVQLEYQLVKKQQIVQNQRKYIEQYQHKMQKNSVKKQNFNNNNNNNQHVGHRIIVASKNGIHQSTENNTKIQKLMQQLQARQSQLVKYMHKQTQFVQIYVQKQQLLHQIRTLQSTIHVKNKQIQQLKKYDRKQKMDISFNDKYKLQTSYECEDHESSKDNNIKITQYNEKLLGKLKFSGQEIQRLNNLLKIKDQEVKNLKNLCQMREKQINDLQFNVEGMKSREDALLEAVYQRQIKIQCRQCKDKDKLIQQIKQHYNLLQISLYQKTIAQAMLQDKNKQLQTQNADLLARVNDQIEASLKLKDIITKLQQDKNKKINNTNQMKQLQTSTELSEEVQEKYTQTQQQQRQDYGQLQRQKNNKNLDKTNKIQDHQIYTTYINSLKQQNQHLSNFIMQQGKHISDLRNQNYLLTRSNTQTKQYIQKLQSTDKRIPELIKKANYLEQKLQQVTKQYQKLLVEVQKSYNQSQNIHKHIQNKLQQLSQDFPKVKSIRMNSQFHSNSRVHLNIYNNQEPFQIFYADSKILQINNMPQSKIKQQKSQSLAQLIIKN